MRKLAMSLSKGGVGKSTTAVHLAHGLAFSGSKVLLVDTNTQGQCAPFLGVRPPAGLAELVNGETQPEEAITLCLKGGDSLEQARAMPWHSDPKTTMIYVHNLARVADGAERYIRF